MAGSGTPEGSGTNKGSGASGGFGQIGVPGVTGGFGTAGGFGVFGSSGTTGTHGGFGVSGGSGTITGTPGSLENIGGSGATGAHGGFGSTDGLGMTSNTGRVFGSMQNNPGGLLGPIWSDLFSQPWNSTSTGLGFGATNDVSSSLFGNNRPGNCSGLLSQPSNLFNANKPSTFGSPGTSTGSSSIFGSTNTTSSLTGGTNYLFGGSGFPSAQPLGTTIKFSPTAGSDIMIKDGVSTNINTRHHCITAMTEYENMSLEELRLEDYQAGKKGSTNQRDPGMGNLFGSATAMSSTTITPFGSTVPNTSLSFGQNNQQTTNFGLTSASSYRNTAGSMFAQQNQQQASSLFKATSQTTTVQNTVPSFGDTNTMEQTDNHSTGVFRTTSASQSVRLFGNSQPSMATSFGAVPRLFGPTNTAFGNVGPQQQNLFKNQIIGFDTSNSLPPSSTSTGFSGNKVVPTMGTGTNTSTFNFGSNPAGGSLFWNKLATGEQGNRLEHGFGTVGPGQPFVIGDNQNNLGSQIRTMGVLETAEVNTGNYSQSFSAPQPIIGLNQPNATDSQQSLVLQMSTYMKNSPYEDSPLFRNPLPNPETHPKPTTAQRSLRTQYKLRTLPLSERHRSIRSKTIRSQMIRGMTKDRPTISDRAFLPRKNISNMKFKYITNPQIDDNMMASECLQGRYSPSEEEEEEDAELWALASSSSWWDSSNDLNQCYTNPIIKPIPQHPVKYGQQEALCSTHNSGVVLSRIFFDTIPSMPRLAERVDDKEVDISGMTMDSMDITGDRKDHT